MFRQRLIEAVGTLDAVSLGASRRAPPGTVGLHLDVSHAHADERAFLLGLQFAHVHAADDGSLNLILPEPSRTEAIEAGWAEPHPLAGRPTTSPDMVMIYAPRDPAEVGVVASLVRVAWRNARLSERSLRPAPTCKWADRISRQAETGTET